jgi:hypothetical protein
MTVQALRGRPALPAKMRQRMASQMCSTNAVPTIVAGASPGATKASPLQ